MVNPVARDTFKTLRDEDERDLNSIRSMFLAMESRPMIFKAFIPVSKNSK